MHGGRGDVSRSNRCSRSWATPALGDRLEKLAFNALPATFKKDMRAHQYDQQVNQVVCAKAASRVYTNNGPDSNLYGLEPNFGCCTANLHQGWPKFVVAPLDAGRPTAAWRPVAGARA